MMPRKSSEDDRPMGLKFTRTNFFNFTKQPQQQQQNNESSSSPPPPLLKRTPSNQQQQQVPLTMKDASAFLHNSNRDSDLSSTTSSTYQPSLSSPPPMLSPTLPARSPFRIRDSQQQQQQQQQQQLVSNMNKSSHGNT
jgi:hypothetical protein